MSGCAFCCTRRNTSPGSSCYSSTCACLQGRILSGVACYNGQCPLAHHCVSQKVALVQCDGSAAAPADVQCRVS